MYEVAVFVAAGCPFCDAAIDATRRLPSVPDRTVRIVDVHERPGLRERLARQTGCPTLPSVWVGNTYIGGLNTGPPAFGGLANVIAKDLWHAARLHDRM